MFSWGKTTEERMISEIGSELESYRRRLESLHEEFRKKLHTRDEARAALSEADGRIEELQKEGLFLLNNLSSATSEREAEKLKKLDSNSKKNTRELVRAKKHRERLTRRLESVEVDDEKAVRDLKIAASEVLDEYSGRTAERKQWLADTAETLNSQWQTLAQEASPLTGKYEPGDSKQLPATEDQ